MKLKTGGERQWEECPEGTHPARCCGVIQLGRQPNSNPKYLPRDTLRIEWEIAAERTSDDKPFVVAREYNHFVSLGRPSHLRTDLEAWRGQAFDAASLDRFDLANLLGAAALVTVVHKPRATGNGVWVNVTQVTRPPKGLAVPELEAEPVLFDFAVRDPDTFNRLPQWIQKRIMNAEDWEAFGVESFALTGNGGDDEELNDDIPF